MTDRPKRAWWRKKRWWLAALVWVAVAYPLSVGPAIYLRYDDTLPKGAYRTVYGPLWAAHHGVGLSDPGPFTRYTDWWGNLAYRMDHRSPPPGP